jgi:hypothetical protein
MEDRRAVAAPFVPFVCPFTDMFSHRSLEPALYALSLSLHPIASSQSGGVSSSLEILDACDAASEGAVLRADEMDTRRSVSILGDLGGATGRFPSAMTPRSFFVRSLNP